MLELAISKKLNYFDLNINFQINKEILVLLGPSGAGKTTILDCIAGLRNPDGGLIKLNERILYSSSNKTNIPTRQRNIGYLFQEYALFPHMNVKNNITYGLAGKCRCETFANKLSIKDVMDILQITNLQNRNPSQLSGGEKQRVAMARALMVEPELLLLDEPFSALDKKLKRTLINELINIHKIWQIPIVLITHDHDEAEFLGDKIIQIEAGKISTTLTPYSYTIDNKVPSSWCS